MADKRRLTVHWRSIGSIEYLVLEKGLRRWSALMLSFRTYDDARVSKLAVTFELLPKFIVECGDLVGSVAEEFKGTSSPPLGSPTILNSERVFHASILPRPQPDFRVPDCLPQLK
jgi:hypothetical protein